ncbi:amidohydrolase [Dorea formicigenerans]|uniref:Amidohydrolase n=1 Tax=Dorea formicigenerans TaxID=39486 RepID=A0A414QAR5_9FIRM|nr:M20 family metallopeptidase [Dorea formicigenerans]RHF77875.1 amidohydrolase [Dorea formicigenerans]
MGEKQIVDIIKSKAKEIEEELVSIRHELHKHPELGVELHETHDIISRELHKIPELEVQEHKAGGSGVIAILHGGKPEGKTVLLRADIDALPIEEEVDSPYKSEKQGCMHACGHDGHAAWLIGAAKILASIREEWGGCIKFVFQPGEEIGRGAMELVKEDHVLENPKVDMAFAAHGWPTVESGKIGIARRYAFGCVGAFAVEIIGKKGHASWPEQTIDPIAVANEVYQHIPAILARKISGTDSGIMSVTYMQAGVEKIKNVIPQICKFGGTMRTTKRETMEKMAVELKNELRAICEVYGAAYKSDIKIHGGAVENSPILLDQVREAAGEILGQEQSYIIEGDNLGGENFSEYSNRVPAVYMFIGIKPKDKAEIPGLHSPIYQFDDGVLANASSVFAMLGYQGCMGMLENS